jgi:hypothetical protein
MTQAGELTPEQLTLLFSHMPVGFSVADQDDVVRFWAGAGFEVCSPILIGRDLRACHPKRAQAALEGCSPTSSPGPKTRSTRSSAATTAPSASSTRPCVTRTARIAACWRLWYL